MADDKNNWAARRLSDGKFLCKPPNAGMHWTNGRRFIFAKQRSSAYSGAAVTMGLKASEFEILTRAEVEALDAATD